MTRLQDEKDPDILRQAALLLERENQRLVAKIIELTRELVALKGGDAEQMKLRIAELERQLATRNRKLFGASSEKRSTADESKPESEEPKPPPKGHGPRAQPALPIQEQIHTLDAADQTCPSCGGDLAAWEEQFEESDEVDVLERRFVMVKHKRQKYRCRCGGCIETAPGPVKLFEGARYSVNFAVEVSSEKYLEHAPLERQVRKMGREGLIVESQTLWDQIERLARLLMPAYAALVAYVLSKPVIGADETRWPLLGSKSPGRWHAWAIAAPDAVAYQIHDSRSMEAARKVLGGYEGVVMCDGYQVYQSLAKENPSLELARCWAHVRREFVEIEQFFPEQAKMALDLIGELYAIEALCPTGEEGDELRRKLREERSQPVVDQLRRFAMSTVALPQSGLGKAIGYLVGGLKSGLLRFLENPRVPLDNNATERAVRGPVVGRKHHYGSRSRRGTEVAALYYSLLESAKLVRIDPKAYLRMAAMAALRGERIPLPHEVAREV
jgi:transposase